jgi:hypothetical protein
VAINYGDQLIGNDPAFAETRPSIELKLGAEDGLTSTAAKAGVVSANPPIPCAIKKITNDVSFGNSAMGTPWSRKLHAQNGLFTADISGLILTHSVRPSRLEDDPLPD